MRLFDRVYRIMERSAVTRNSDKMLLLEVWREQGLTLDAEQTHAFMKVATAESVTRARRKIQETEFKGAQAIQDARAAKAQEYSQRAVASHYEAKAVSWLHDDVEDKSEPVNHDEEIAEQERQQGLFDYER